MAALEIMEIEEILDYLPNCTGEEILAVMEILENEEILGLTIIQGADGTVESPYRFKERI